MSDINDIMKELAEYIRMQEEAAATEKARYTEQQAEQLLTSLIYRELLKGAKTK